MGTKPESQRLCANLLARITVRLSTSQPIGRQRQPARSPQQPSPAGTSSPASTSTNDQASASVPSSAGSATSLSASSSKQLVQQLLPQLQPRLRLLAPHMLALTMWAYAKQDLLHGSLFQAATAAATPVLHTLKPRFLSNMIYACSCSPATSPAFFDAVAAASVRSIARFNTQVGRSARSTA